MSTEQTDNRTYRVVRNDEEQYSIWWAERDLPAGWHAEGTEGSRELCLSHIAEIWTDMRPLSLRERMADAGAA
ncbi:MbtH family NRPS accessory protein [Streptomyces sp. NPDC005811]|uniref:MbtH family protein n=1 Tax=Streptomyces sp. NPDC005811 TaxID=3154565 RepID=UPI00340528A7